MHESCPVAVALFLFHLSDSNSRYSDKRYSERRYSDNPAILLLEQLHPDPRRQEPAVYSR